MNRTTLFARIKALAGAPDWTEVYTFVLLSVGVPFAVYLFTDWKVAVSVAIVIQVVLGVLALRSRGSN